MAADARMRETALDLQAVVIAAASRAGLAVFVHVERDAVHTAAMGAPAELFGRRSAAELGDQLASGSAGWS